MSISRRHFIARSTAFGLGFAGLQSAFARRVLTERSPKIARGPFGPLLPDPEGIFDLPEGFSYKVISRAGEMMVDGFRVPARPDAMAAFPGGDGMTLICCNHEVSGGVQNEGPFGDQGQFFTEEAKRKAFDRGTGLAGAMPGGTTTLVYDTRKQQLVRRFLSLAGTERNCAGGPTPWGSWITCEETVSRTDQLHEKTHGYCFDVPMTQEPKLQYAEPIRAMGRFNHEAVAVDPETGIVYQTEDRHEGLLYRYIPDVPGQLARGGRLQALVIQDAPSADTRNWPPPFGQGRTIEPGTKLKAVWMDLQEAGIDIDSPDDSMRLEGFAKGAARFARGEGMWWGQVGDPKAGPGEPACYFACTNGGIKRLGQVWKLSPSRTPGNPADAPDTLELFVESESSAVIDKADNITVSPFGHLIVCEDGGGEQRLVGVTPEGDAYELARNALSESELAGACFSPDGTTLFVNIQHNGLTLAVTGPWEKA